MAVQVTDLQLLRDQLILRQQKLQKAITKAETANLVLLLEQVDKALERFHDHSYGVCEVCHGTVEADRLLADPLASVCLDCLSPEQARALERDLELAARIQTGLLPKQDYAVNGWHVSYHYEPAGTVSGDYVDLMSHGNELYFMLGDVSGKGVAASMLMANLHAMFRALVPAGLPLHQLVERANRIFCESTLPTQYATLICGRAGEGGEVELSNSGHLAPLHVSAGSVTSIDSTTVPIGLFCDQQFTTTRLQFSPGDSLVIYTDGLTEALGHDGAEYGAPRLAELLARCTSRGSRELVDECIKDVLAFRANAQKFDDQSLMALHFRPVRH